MITTIIILSIIVVLLVMHDIAGIGKASDLESKNFELKASNYSLEKKNKDLKNKLSLVNQNLKNLKGIRQRCS